MAASINSTTVVVSPLSTTVAKWHSLTSQTLADINTKGALFFGTVGAFPTSYDHISALSVDATKPIVVGIISTIAKVNTVTKLGAGYITQIGSASGVTEATALGYMYESMADYANNGGGTKVFDFSTPTDTVEVLKGAIARYQAATSRRRTLLQADADLSALADVMLVIFDSIESSKTGADVSTMVEGITKASIAAETEVMKDVQDLASGKVTPSAFKEANTKEKISAKVASAVVPESFSASLQAALEPESTEKKSTSSSSDDDTVIIVVCVVVGAVVLAGAAFGLHKYNNSTCKGRQKVKVLPVALDPTRSPDLEKGPAGKLPPLESAGSGSSDQGKVSVMPFVEPASPTPKQREETEDRLRQQQGEIAGELE